MFFKKRLLIFILLAFFVIFVIIKILSKINLSDYILLITAAVIFWYSYETFLLRLQTQKNTVLNVKPILSVKAILDNLGLEVENIGYGPALNIEISISHLNLSGDYTNLRNFSRVDSNNYFNIGRDKIEYVTEIDINLFRSYCDEIRNSGNSPSFTIILIYKDLFGNRFQTIRRIFADLKNKYTFKESLFGSYDNGELLKFKKTDITH